MRFFLRRKDVIFRVLFVLVLLTAVLWVSAHTLRPTETVPETAEESGEVPPEEEEPEPAPAGPVVAGEVTVDPMIARRVEEIRAAGEIPRIAAPVEDLPMRAEENPKSKLLMNIPTGTLLAEIPAEEEPADPARIRVREPESGLEGYITASYAPVIDYPAVDPSLLPVVRTDTALYTWEELCEDVDLLCAMYPDLLSTRDLRPSTDGRRIPMMVFGNPDAPVKIFVQAAIHGREYMTAQLVMKMTEYYAAYFATGSYRGIPYRELFEQTEWTIIPMSNPDGVSISQFGEEGARTSATRLILRRAFAADRSKTIRDQDTYLKLWKANARGVDLNNNFDAGWETIQEKDHPSQANYPGPRPVSEPESQNLVDVELSQDYAASVSYHSMGNLIYYDADGKKSEDAMRSLVIAEIISGISGYSIEMERSADLKLGGFTDWLQLRCHRAGVTVEVGTNPCPLEIREFLPIWFRNRECWAALAASLISE